MNDEKIRHAMQACPSGVTFSPARQQAVLRAVRESSRPRMRRKLSLGMVLAIMLALLATGGAVAAGLGVFGRLADKDNMSAPQDELKRLDEAAAVINQQVFTSMGSDSSFPDEPATDFETLLRAHLTTPANCTLTLNQAYCDGHRLSYSFTEERDEIQWFRGVGMPTGIEEYALVNKGCTYREYFPSGPWTDAIASWLDSHDASWIAFTNVNVGDGADLADGTDMMVVEGSSVSVDDRTSQGFYTVTLPEGYDPGDTITFQLYVMSSLHLIAQDEEGFYEYFFPSQIQRFNFTAPVSRDVTTMHGSANFADYTAVAQVSLSKVTMTGTVSVMNPPAAWSEALFEPYPSTDYLEIYMLVVNGEEVINYDASGHLTPDGTMVFTLQFDLPEEGAELCLRPHYRYSGAHPDEDIPLILDQKER